MSSEVTNLQVSAVGSSDQDERRTQFNSQAVAQVEPAYYELARGGKLFVGGTSVIGNGIAGVTAIPTTTAALALYNSDSTNRKNLVLLKATFFAVSGTIGNGAALMACVSSTTISSPATSNDTGTASQSARGSGENPVAILDLAQTIPSGSAWITIASHTTASSAQVGGGVNMVDLAGALVARPNYSIGFSVLSPTGTSPVFGVSLIWAEFNADLP